jgi:hypothetical protein
MRATLRTAAFAVATSVFVAIPASAHQACATNHMRARLEVFSEGSVSRPLYWAAENDGRATFTVRIIGSGCDGSASTISYEVRPGSATTPADYVAPSGSITFVNTVGHPDTERRDITITNDGVSVPLDEAVEMATVVLTGASGGSLIPPTSAPLIIVDDDGPAPRISLADGPYEESESTPEGGVPVFRAGDASGTSTVDWALTAGTATPGDDYSDPTSGTLTFGPGSRMELIPVTVVDDAEKEPPETLTVSISGPLTEGTTSVPFTITDNEEDIPPTSSLHHPNNKRKYRASHYLIREIHIFTRDQGGAGTVAAEFALRRNMKGGKCAWWSGKRFKKGKCNSERWLKTGQYETDFFYIRLKELQPSVGKIRNYTAYSRAIDGAKNVESHFEVGRNANTFKVRKPKRAR